MNIALKQRYDDKYFRAEKIIEQWDYLEDKFTSMLTNLNLSQRGECAFICLLMMKTGIRVGNESSAEGYICINRWSDNYAKRVKTFGATTLLKEHVWHKGNKIYLSFTGKKQVEQSFVVEDKFMVLVLQDLLVKTNGTKNLFTVTNSDLTKFVKRYIGRQFSPKDLRTAYINRMADISFDLADKIYASGGFIEGYPLERKASVNKLSSFIIEKVAGQVGHTKSVCKRNYISPLLIETWKENFYELLQRSDS